MIKQGKHGALLGELKEVSARVREGILMGAFALAPVLVLGGLIYGAKAGYLGTCRWLATSNYSVPEFVYVSAYGTNDVVIQPAPSLDSCCVPTVDDCDGHFCHFEKELEVRYYAQPELAGRAIAVRVKWRRVNGR
jgi:hypothetical protein